MLNNSINLFNYTDLKADYTNCLADGINGIIRVIF